MARVRLRGIWINDAEDESDFLELRKGSDFQPGTTTAGTAEVGAGGRIRAIVQGNQAATWSIAAEWLTRDMCEWLRLHEGRLVWVRDWHGRKVHGWWLTTPIQVHDGNWARVTLTINEITADDT